MRILGTLERGADSYELAANEKLVAKFSVAEEATLSALSIWADGGGAGFGTQPLRGVIYDADENLVAVGDEIAVDAGAEVARISAPFWLTNPGGVTLPAGDYFFGVHAGSPGGVVRLYGAPSGVGGLDGTGDPYADGSSGSFGDADATDHDLSLFAPWFTRWSPPEGETEEWYARLPFPLAESVFMAEGVSPVEAACSWHYTRLDPETGAFAVVHEDGPLAGYVGQRIRVRAGSKAVAVFVHSQGQLLNADLSLTRRAFAAIGELPIGDSIPVTVEVIPA